MRHSTREAFSTGTLIVIGLLGLGTTSSRAQAPSRPAPYSYARGYYAAPTPGYVNPRPAPGYAAPASPPAGRRSLPARLRPLDSHEYGPKDFYSYKS